MSQKNDLSLSMRGEVFRPLCDHFDGILRNTIEGMISTEQDAAEINIKVKIYMEESSAPDYSVQNQTREITKPKFEHTVSAVIQRKEKRTGTFENDCELVWDKASGQYVARPLDNGQMNMFEEEDKETIEGEYKELPEGEPLGLPACAENAIDMEESKPASEAFDWIRQYVGQKLHIVEALGNITARSEDNGIVLSSACDPSSPFYCPQEQLEPHIGHNVLCVGYGPEDATLVNVSVECEDCQQCIYSIDAPSATEEEVSEALKTPEGSPLTAEETAEAMDAAADIVAGINDAEDGTADEESECSTCGEGACPIEMDAPVDSEPASYNYAGPEE